LAAVKEVARVAYWTKKRAICRSGFSPYELFPLGRRTWICNSRPSQWILVVVHGPLTVELSSAEIRNLPMTPLKKLSRLRQFRTIRIGGLPNGQEFFVARRCGLVVTQRSRGAC